MDSFLPLFPLQLVVFPGEQLNLHIFEPRYKELIKDCEEEGISFGIPAFLDGKVQDVGTEIELLEVVKRHQNGELDIRTQGIGVFKILNFYREAPNKLYAGGDIEKYVIESEGDYLLNEKILELTNRLFLSLNVQKELPDSASSLSTFDIAHHVGFSIKQEYEYLCLSTELERQNYMITHLEKLIPIVEEMERLRKRVQMNGHFKNIIPPKI